MNPAVAALLTYIPVMIGLQILGFVVSRAIDYVSPAFSLITFLMLFIASMYLAWPIAVRIVERYVLRAQPAPIVR
jgi:hypothetical protein